MKNNNAILLTAYEKYGSIGKEEYTEMYIDEELTFADDMLWKYNDYLEENNLYDDQWFSMGEFDEIMSGCSPWEVARAAFYGDFKPADDYFRFNGYGNLVSASDYEVEKEIMEDRDFLRWYIEEENLIDWDEVEEEIEEANELIKRGW